MALKKCHECDGTVSTEAERCPHCGAKPKKGVGPLGIVFAGMLGLAAFQCASPRTPAEPAARPEPTAEQAAAKKARAEEDARFSAARNAVRALRKSLKDPDSLQVETIAVSEDRSTTCILYRAKNSFNATVLEGYVFDGNIGSTRADVIKKVCDTKKQTFFDLSYAK